MKPILSLKNISKEYFGNKVLKDISLEVMPGEIHALCGENGAGKSTLMNILFGMSVIHETGGFQGEVEITGEKVSITSPKDAMKLGIGMVHQEFMLIPGFSVSENIKLNREPTKTNIFSKLNKNLETIDQKKVYNDSKKALDRLGIDLAPEQVVNKLPVGYMQFVEIAREIDKDNIKLLVFDEPTAVLSETEATRFLEVIKKLANDGVGILFITHRLDEVTSVSNKITILRDGTHIKTMNTTDTNVAEIAELMVGRKIDLVQKEKSNKNFDKVILSMKDLKVNMPGERVKNVNLDVYEGEILGIGGLAGQGKIGISNGLMGIYNTSGEIILNGESLPLNSPKTSILKGLSFVSEDRREVGLLADTSIAMNIVIPSMANQGRFLKDLKICKLKDTKQINQVANKYIKELDIRCTDESQQVGRLSGGNQQKVCIARALELGAKVLLVSEPTRGIDIGAKSIVLDTLKDLNKKYGITVIITSSELAELRIISDRIAIITDGEVAGILAPNDLDHKFGMLMSGIKEV